MTFFKVIEALVQPSVLNAFLIEGKKCLRACDKRLNNVGEFGGEVGNLTEIQYRNDVGVAKRREYFRFLLNHRNFLSIDIGSVYLEDDRLVKANMSPGMHYAGPPDCHYFVNGVLLAKSCRNGLKILQNGVFT